MFTLVQSTVAEAVEWINVTYNDNAKYFIDKHSIRKTQDNLIEFWVKINYSSPKESDDKSTKYLSEKNLFLLDCQKNTSKQPYAVFFSKSNGDGIVIGEYKNKRAPEIPINPESVADFYRIYVCNFKS